MSNCKIVLYFFYLFFISSICFMYLGKYLVHRCVVAGAILQTPFLFIQYLGEGSFVEISSEHLHSKTVGARKPTFWEKVHLSLPVMCHMPCVMCQVLCVMCHMSHVKFFVFLFFLDKVVKLGGRGSVIKWLACLVFSSFHNLIIFRPKINLSCIFCILP